MIQLLVDFCLAAEVKTELHYDPNIKQYFVPAMLPTFNGDLSSAITPGYKLRATPLHITFGTRFVIPGFFTHLVTSIAGAKMGQKWFKCGPICSLRFDYIFRNRITFDFDGNHVTLTELPNAIQVDLLRYIPDSAKVTTIKKSCKFLKVRLIHLHSLIKITANMNSKLLLHRFFLRLVANK